ncbi:MAG: glycosyltransferase family 39 protein [Salinivirgaceae bacterium]|jgi:mannosyltransferase|nr:glycosyltransferase family 39 protein [Salinivirgaceae bacterium]
MNLKSYDKKSMLPIFITGIILLANLAFKLFIIHGKSLYGDEPFTLYFSQQPFLNIIDRLVNDSNPFLHPFLLHTWIKIFGVTAFSGKLLSAILSSLTAALLFKLFYKRFGLLMPLIASVLFTLSEINLFYAQEIRAFALVGVLTTVSIYLFFEIIYSPKKKHIILLGVVNLSLVMSHYAAFLLPVVESIGILFFIRSHKKSVLYFIYSQSIALLLFAPWFIYSVMNNIPQAGKSWIPVPKLINLKYLILKLTTSRLLITYIVLLIASSSVLFIKRTTETSFRKTYLLFILFFWVPILLNYAISQSAPIMLSRYLLFTTIPFYLSIGYFISQIAKIQHIRLTISIIVILIASYKIKLPKTPDNWIGKLDRIKKERSDNSIVFINAWWQYRPFAYYYDYQSFIDFNNTLHILKNQNIHAVSSITQIEKILENKKYDKIFLVKNQGIKSDEIVAHLKNKGYQVSWKNTTKTPFVFALEYKH